MQAVELLDAARCPGCGQPTWLSHDKATRRKWKVRADRCFACDAAEERREQMDKAEPQRPGAIHYSTEYAG